MGKYAKMKTAVPGPKTKEVLDRFQKTEAWLMGWEAPLVLDRAQGCLLWDIDGNQYIDWSSGVLVANIGHCHPHLVKTLAEVNEKIHNTYDVPTQYRIEAGEAILRILPEHMDSFFFFTVGTEVTEAAIRIMKRRTGGFEIVGASGGFHGRTMGAASAGGLARTKFHYGPVAPGQIRIPFPYCYRCPFNQKEGSCNYLCLEYSAEQIRTSTSGYLAGLIIEPYLGGGGCVPCPDGYLPRLEKMCHDEFKMMFTLDEVQSGYGRCGTFWACQRENVKPDIITSAKGMGGGAIVAMVATTKDALKNMNPGDFGSTWSGNAGPVAGAKAVVEVFESEPIIENCNKMHEIFMKRLKEMEDKYEIAGNARGWGLALGLEIVEDKKSKTPSSDLTHEIICKCAEKGLFMGNAGIYGNVLRVCPPLIINEEQANESLDILDSVLASMSK